MPDEFPKASTAEIALMPRYRKFEHQIPFYMMRLDHYEGRIKRLIYDKEKTRLTMTQL